jgi:mRNA interferase RelE/StbE
MPYQIIIKPTAEKSMDKIPLSARRRIADAIEELRSDPRPAGVVKLAGDDNLWRIRIGNYRVVYEIHDDRLIVLVLRVAHRKDVYRGE